MIDLNVRIDGFKEVDFNPRGVKPVIRREATAVKKIAQKLISNRAKSSPGQLPGRDTGLMKKSIKSKVWRGKGMGATVAPYRVGRMLLKDDGFYPAYVVYGTSRGLKPRKNFMDDAFNQRREHARNAIHNALLDNIKVR